MSWLFPDERKFYEDFSGIATRVRTVATILEEALDHPSRMRGVAGADRAGAARGRQGGARARPQPGQAVHPADGPGGHPPPVDPAQPRGRHHRRHRPAGGELPGHDAAEPAVALARIVVRAVTEIEAAVRDIRTGDDVLERCREIKRAEEEGDAVWEAAVTELFAGRPIRWT